MTVHDLFTPESLSEVERRRSEFLDRANRLMNEYRVDHAAESQTTELREWIQALEDSDLNAAASSDLWSRLAAAGFIEADGNWGVHRDHATFYVRIVSAKILDAFQTETGPKATYAYTTVKVCLRKEPAPPSLVPDNWKDAALIDTEFFELPHGTALDSEADQKTLDDMEKIHVVYIAGTKDGKFISKPVYIGVGTGEAYGTGPSNRDTIGRYRFYRYDAKDNRHLEYVKVTEGPEFEKRDVTEVAPIPLIGKDKPCLLLGRGGGDTGFMCLSDPSVEAAQQEFFKMNVLKIQITKEVTLEKMHETLEQGKKPSTPFRSDDVRAVLGYAWTVYRWFYVAWLHPQRLTEIEGLAMYYKRLPSWRREQYEIYRIRPEFVGLSPEDAMDSPLTIAHVVTDNELRDRLEKNVPGSVKYLEEWLRARLIEDLYDFGNHPELRLCTAITLSKRLADSGLWDRMVEATYRGKLYEIELGIEAICAARSDGGDSQVR